ncbi:GNAT family N-acetyltransferase [Cochlodiniinecator piscidefendens]|uniref:GNAT family N-acetyltransferase n=1 Tax=Cochlodiniinecator piscidefendens TaxID=2715756 RepID=UPI00140960C2|nr:GNAT family N-acetyltransferase [Cochlodiniinecator piscidefendens]
MNMLHLAQPEDRAKLSPLIAGYHAYAGLPTSDDEREDALEQLFSGDIHAAIWLIGPRRSPVGYIAVTFGFSLSKGGRSAQIDEFFVRESVRGRGMGSAALAALVPTLRDFGVHRLLIAVDQSNQRALKLSGRAGFTADDTHLQLIRDLS